MKTETAPKPRYRAKIRQESDNKTWVGWILQTSGEQEPGYEHWEQSGFQIHGEDREDVIQRTQAKLERWIKSRDEHDFTVYIIDEAR